METTEQNTTERALLLQLLEAVNSADEFQRITRDLAASIPFVLRAEVTRQWSKQ